VLKPPTRSSINRSRIRSRKRTRSHRKCLSFFLKRKWIIGKPFTTGASANPLSLKGRSTDARKLVCCGDSLRVAFSSTNERVCRSVHTRRPTIGWRAGAVRFLHGIYHQRRGRITDRSSLAGNGGLEPAVVTAVERPADRPARVGKSGTLASRCLLVDCDGFADEHDPVDLARHLRGDLPVEAGSGTSAFSHAPVEHEAHGVEHAGIDAGDSATPGSRALSRKVQVEIIDTD
jgi:hypothetical protein